MNATKYIHVLLVIALCFGQLVSTVHAVGHFHAHEADCASELTFEASADSVKDHCKHALPAFSGVSQTAHPHDGHLHGTQPPPDGANDLNNNCSIYHALFGLSCVFFTAQTLPVEPFQRTAQSNYSFTYITSDALEHQPIRAPPVIN